MRNICIVRDLTMQCNNAEYKRMGQDLSLGQLHNVQNKIKICTKHWLGLFNYYDTGLIFVSKERTYLGEPNVCGEIGWLFSFVYIFGQVARQCC